MVPEGNEAVSLGKDHKHPDIQGVAPVNDAGGPLFGVRFILGLTLCVCLVSYMLQDRIVAIPLAVFGVLYWHTRRHPYATLPGSVIGFVLGMITSVGIGPASELSCGLAGSIMGATLNAICSRCWRSGLVALMALIAYVVAVQLVLLSI